MDLNNLFEDLDKLELDTSNSEQPGAVEIIKEPSLADDRLASDLAGQKHYWLYSARGDNWWLFRGEDAQTIEDGKVMGLDKVNIQSVGCQITVDLVRMIQTTSSGHFRNVKRVSHDELARVSLRGIAGKRYNSEVLQAWLQSTQG